MLYMCGKFTSKLPSIVTYLYLAREDSMYKHYIINTL